MDRRSVPLIVLALLAAPAVAGAQWSCDAVLRPPAPGSYAEWNLNQSRVTIALLGREEQGYRFEMQSPGSGMPGPMVLQLLVPKYPYRGEDALEFVVQMGGNPPMKLAGQMREMLKARAGGVDLGSIDRCPTMTYLGQETITVPAGSIPTHHLRDPATGDEFWVSEAVPFAVVRMKGRTTTLELTGRGTGYRSLITARPVDMPGAGRP